MTPPAARIYFDLVDPLSYLVHRELEAIRHELEPAQLPSWRPFELRPPPTPLTTLSDPGLVERWNRAREAGAGVAFAPPDLVPWTRKAHELLHYAPTDRAAELRARLFEAYLLEGRDIGRVDVLVATARTVGLDVTETKAVLDVDRETAGVLAARSEADASGVTDTPVILRGERRLEGFHNRTTLGTFLRTPTARHDDPNHTD